MRLLGNGRSVWRFLLGAVLALPLIPGGAGFGSHAAWAQNGPDSQWQVAGHSVTFHEAGVHVAGLRIGFVGAEPMLPTAAAEMPSGGDRSQLASSSSPFPLTYRDLWPGVSLRYETAPGILIKSTFLVEPGAVDVMAESVAAIRLDYHTPVSIAADGSLHIASETGPMSESAPVAWQVRAGERVPVLAAFRRINATTVGFTVEGCIPHLPLVIDPILSWNTFLGGSSSDVVEGMTTDSAGNVYIVGTSYADWGGSPVDPYGGNAEAFAAKLDNDGSLLWHTFLGSSITSDYGYGIAVDDSGSVYVVGASYATWGSPLNSFGGNQDGFLAKLNSSGVRQWHVFLGKTYNDTANAVVVANSGSIYIVGTSESSDWTTPTPKNGWAGGEDAFLVQVNASGGVQWLTFMGSAADDFGESVALDASENVFVAGTSENTWGSSPQRGYSAGDDAFVASFTSSGERTWHSFLGGTGKDEGSGIAVAGDGTPVVTGSSGVSWGTSPVNAYTGGTDAFAARLTSGGALAWNTFMGSGSSDKGQGIAVKAADIYISGTSGAAWGSPLFSYHGGDDVFVAQLSGAGARQWHLFLGSNGSDGNSSTSVTDERTIFLAGKSSAAWGSPISAHTGSDDAFVARFDYSVSGNILSRQGSPLAGVAISASNGRSTYSTTGGAYTITGFITGTFVLTPTLSEYLFSPATQTVVLPPDVSDADFAADPITYTIAGQVTDGDSQPLPEAVVHCNAITQTTNGAGVYTFTGLLAGSYWLTPTLEGYRFDPSNQMVALGPSRTDVGFQGDQMGIFLPLVIAPAHTELYITNGTSQGVSYSVFGTPHGTVSCNIGVGIVGGYCGHFLPGAYSVRVNAPACDNPVATGVVTFLPGYVLREVRCQ
jgi:hypothetical protein